MKYVLTSIAAFAATSASAGVTVINGLCYDMASGKQVACNPVPEISALEGTAALAALTAIVFIAWERRRRAA